MDGFLHLLDRTSDMIITGGYNVYLREVEHASLSHPAVMKSAVVGISDKKWIETIVAFIEITPGHGVDADTLVAHVAGQIASYKKPHRFVSESTLPKITVGKLNRKVLRAKVHDEAA